MKREAIQALNQTKWVKLFEADPLEVALKPSQARLLQHLFLGTRAAEKKAIKQICQLAFTDFRGYFNGDGSEIPNSLQARVELFTTMEIGRRIQEELIECNELTAQGEEGAASD